MEFKDLPIDVQHTAAHTLHTILRDESLDDDGVQAKKLARNISAAFVELFSCESPSKNIDRAESSDCCHCTHSDENTAAIKSSIAAAKVMSDLTELLRCARPGSACHQAIVISAIDFLGKLVRSA